MWHLFVLKHSICILLEQSTKKDCQQCDVCLENKDSQEEEKLKLEKAQEEIMLLLGDKEKHPVTDLHNIKLPTQLVNKALEALVAENRIHIDGSLLYY